MSDDLPSGWSEHQLGEIAELFNGKAGGTGGTWLRVFKTRHVYDGFLRLTDPAFAPDDKAVKVPPSTFLRSGDTLTPNMAHGTIGRVAFVREAEDKWTVDGQVMVIRPKNGAVIGRYLFDWLSRPESKRQLVGMEKGGAFDELRGQTHIYRSDVGGIRVWLPTVAEQQKIAAILSSVDDAIEATQKVIDQIQVVKKAMMAELLTWGLPGRHTKFKMTEIGEIPEEWAVVRLAQVADVAYGLTVNGQRKASTVTRPYLTVANVQQEGFDLSTVKEIGVLPGDTERYELRTGDLLIVEGNANPDRLGRAFVWDDEVPGALHQNHLIRARPAVARALPRWLAVSVNGASGRRHILDHAKTSSGLHTINSKVVGDLPVPLPSLREQEEIASVYSSLEGRIESERRCLAGLRDTKAALTSVLLTGEVRVTPDEEAA